MCTFGSGSYKRTSRNDAEYNRHNIHYILSKYDGSNKHDFELYIRENSAYLNNNNLLVMGNTSKSTIDTSNISVI